MTRCPLRIRTARDYIDDLLLSRSRQLRNRAIDRFFLNLGDLFHWQIRLRSARCRGFLVTFDELASKPPEYVIGNACRVADIRILSESTRLEPLVSKLLYQALERYPVLQGERGQGRNRVHQSANCAPFFRHLDKQLSRLTVLVQTNGYIAFVTGALEFVGNRNARIRHTIQARLLDCSAKCLDLFLEVPYSAPQHSRLGCLFCTHVLCLFRIKRSGAFRSVAIDRHRLQAKSPAFNIGVHDLVDRRAIRHIDSLGDRTAQKWLTGSHHPQVPQIMQTPLTLKRLERTIEDMEIFRFQPALDDAMAFRNKNILDRVMFVNMRPNLLDLVGSITQLFQRRFYRLVDNLEHASPSQKLVLHQSDVRFNPCRVAVHQEPDRPGRCQDCDLRIPEPNPFSERNRPIPDLD